MHAPTDRQVQDFHLSSSPPVDVDPAFIRKIKAANHKWHATATVRRTQRQLSYNRSFGVKGGHSIFAVQLALGTIHTWGGTGHGLMVSFSLNWQTE